MALIQYAAPWDRQPQESVPVKDLGFTEVFTGASIGYNHATGKQIAVTAGGTGFSQRATPYGLSLYTPNGGWADLAVDLDWSGPNTVSCLVILRGIDANYGGLYSKNSSGTSTQFGVGRDATSNNLYLSVSDAVARPVTASSISALIGVPSILTVTHSGVAATYGYLYLNGVLVGQTSLVLGTQPTGKGSLGLGRERASNASFDSDVDWLGFARAPRVMEADEIQQYFSTPQSFWGLFTPQSIPVPVSAGGGGASGTSATTNASDTSSAGGTTTVTGTSSRTNANDTSSASGTTTVVGTSAKTNADDTSAASGTVGSSGTTGTVAATNANDTAAASGTTKIVGTSSTTNANDAATASGVAGAVSGTVAVTNANDTASAVGDAGAPVASGAGMGFSMSRMRRLVKIQFNGKLYQAFEEDIPELLETLEEQAEQKIKKKRNARAKPAPVATVVSAPADVLPSLQSRIDDVNHSIGVLWGVDEDEDEELLWLML